MADVQQSVALPEVEAARPVKLPFLVWVVLVFTVVAFYGSGTVMGFNLTGIGWVFPLVLSLIILSRNFSAVTFPYLLWSPWALMLLSYLAVVDHSLLHPRVVPLQRTVQLLCPVIVGMAVSTFRLSSREMAYFITCCRRLAYVMLAVTMLKTGILMTGRLPEITGLAGEVMTVMLLCSLFANHYLVSRQRRDIVLWTVLAAVPVIAVTRTAIAAAFLTLPLAFGPMRMSRRIVALALIAAVGLALFYSPRVQKKMFYSGQGTLSDIQGENFRTTGRYYMWEKMEAEIKDEPLTGHGIGMGETFVYGLTRGGAGYPHNDWILIRYDHGMLGVVVFSICLLLAARHSMIRAKYCLDDTARALFLTGASAFIPFCMLMTTDNITVYASFFGNLHFTFLGLAYGALRAQQAAAQLSLIPVDGTMNHV